MPCPVLFSDQESSGSAAKGRREHRKRTLPAGPYALHTIVLRDLYDFLDVISFTQTAKCDGNTEFCSTDLQSSVPRDALTNLNQQEIGA